MTEKKPIRKDRVLIAFLVLVAVILIPVLIRSGRSKAPATPSATSEPSTPPDEGLPTVSIDNPATSTEGTATTTTETTPSSGMTTETPTVDATSEASTSTNTAILTQVVTQGETLAQIASAMNVTVDQLMADNGIVSASQIAPGQTLYASSEGLIHMIESGQTLTDISITYGVPIEDIARANGISDPSRIFAGQRIIIPGVNEDLWQTVIRLSHGKQTRFIWPLEGEITSPFGWRIHPVLGFRHHHNGIDIDVPVGTIVRAAASGKVQFTGEDPEGYGTMLILQHSDGYLTVYGHLSSILVSKGQYVEVGQPIAESGNTGVSTGPHLHFEIRNGEFPVDPQRYLPN